MQHWIVELMPLTSISQRKTCGINMCLMLSIIYWDASITSSWESMIIPIHEESVMIIESYKMGGNFLKKSPTNHHVKGTWGK